MNCLHCGQSAGEVRTNELTTEEALELCNQLNELNTKVINLTGGEPILRRDWIEIGKRIRDLGIDLSILSNGLALDEKIIAQLRELDVYCISLSIDGGTPKTHDGIRGIKGSFDKCILSLELLKKEDLPTTVITTVHKENIKELTLIREQILDKAKAWQIQIAAPIGRFPKNLILSKEEFYSLAMFIAATRKKYSVKEFAVIGAHSIGYHSKMLRSTMLSPIWNGCQAGITTVGILSNGGVKGCLSLPNDYVEGNIREKKLTDIWNDPEFASYNRKFKKIDLKGDCKYCNYSKRCKGGCETVSVTLTGEMHCDPYCLYMIEKEMMTK
jgi:radical SAM protein with 4Fe4S-binding SPASM domain